MSLKSEISPEIHGEEAAAERFPEKTKVETGNPGSKTAKDIVANRARLSPTHKVKLLWNVLRENGVIWTYRYLVYYLSSGIAKISFSKLQRLKLESKKQIPA